MRVFIDMDGTLNKWRNAKTQEELYVKGFFKKAKPHNNVIEAAKMLIRNGYEVFILSAVLDDCAHAVDEKNHWIDKYLPEIDLDHRLYPKCSESKVEFVRNAVGLNKDDVLLDDKTENLLEWAEHAASVKLMNGVNGTKGRWKGIKVAESDYPIVIAGMVVASTC